MNIQVYLPENLKKWRAVQIVVWKTKRFFANLAWPLLWRNLFLLCISLIFVYFILSLQASAQWIDRPYAGFLHQNQVVTEGDFLINRSTNLTGKAQVDLGQTVIVNKGSIITAINQQEVTSSAWLNDYLQQHGQGLVEYTLLEDDNRHRSIKTPVVFFTWYNFIQTVAIPALMGILVLVTAGTAVYVGYKTFWARLFALFCLAIAVHLVSFPGLTTVQLAAVFFGASSCKQNCATVFITTFAFVAISPQQVTKRVAFHTSLNLFTSRARVNPLATVVR